jgi:adenylate kinase family enzyme
MAARRILILGSSGSGKTYLSLRLAQLLELEVIHLDNAFWQPGWRPTAPMEWRQVVSSLVQKDGWIMDGTYENSLDLRLPAVDCVIVIERPRWVCLGNVVMRTIKFHNKPRPDAPTGQKLDYPFIKYIWRYPSVTQPVVYELLGKHGADKDLIVLKGRQAIKQLLAELQLLRGQQGSVQRGFGPKSEGLGAL